MWDILGLDGPTDDAKVIKRAYAKKLKQVKPDESPQEFQILHEAYEAAKAYAKQCKREQAAVAESAASESLEPNIIDEDEAQPALQTSSGSDSADLAASTTNVEAHSQNEASEASESPGDFTSSDDSTTEPESAHLTADQTAAQEQSPELTSDSQSDSQRPSSDSEELAADSGADERDHMEEYHAFMHQVVAYLEDHHQAVDYGAWSQILNAYFLNEFTYKSHASYWIFHTVCGLCEASIQAAREADGELVSDVSTELLHLLNVHFNWAGHLAELEERFDPDAVDFIITQAQSWVHPDEVKRRAVRVPPKDGNHLTGYGGQLLFYRAWATLIDYFLVLAMSALSVVGIDRLLAHFEKAANSDSFFWAIFLLVGALYFGLMESSKLQATLGKRMVKLKVINTRDCGRTSWLRSTLRFGIFTGSMLFFQVFICAYLLFSRRLHIQDVLTTTEVVFKHEYSSHKDA